MEISSEVLLLLGPGSTKRAGSSTPANPIQTLVEALEMLRLAKYFIVTFHPNLSAQNDGRVRDLRQLNNDVYPLVTGLGFMGRKYGHGVDRLALSLRKLTTPSSLLVGKTIQCLAFLPLCDHIIVVRFGSLGQLFISSLTYESTLFLLTLVPGMEPQPKRGWHSYNDPYDKGWSVVFLYYNIRWNLDSKDSNGSSPFTVLCCHDLVHMLSLAPPTSRVHTPEIKVHGTKEQPGQHNEISLQPYTPRKNDYLTTLATSATSFDRMSLKTPV
ncbi:hypothetical protein RhiXN_03959 [Rhizoctonia solani]|uniref:Uncharacterized protein n=1 Tax=Rhizoctonia solani TaxID=456999 RepID=A0A8H8STD3_9AGAM|nr:uncharacterized protein RhiXN_03959 [Rhizoctonia solani]QRW15958.1 hypothetical protein RhiXN_03959 [Rhizoctonia solani]